MDLTGAIVITEADIFDRFGIPDKYCLFTYCSQGYDEVIDVFDTWSTEAQTIFKEYADSDYIMYSFDTLKEANVFSKRFDDSEFYWVIWHNGIIIE